MTCTRGSAWQASPRASVTANRAQTRASDHSCHTPIGVVFRVCRQSAAIAGTDHAPVYRSCRYHMATAELALPNGDPQHPTANIQQPTANSQQPTANSQQPTANSTSRISRRATSGSLTPNAVRVRMHLNTPTNAGRGFSPHQPRLDRRSPAPKTVRLAARFWSAVAGGERWKAETQPMPDAPAPSYFSFCPCSFIVVTAVFRLK